MPSLQNPRSLKRGVIARILLAVIAFPFALMFVCTGMSLDVRSVDAGGGLIGALVAERRGS